MDHVPATSPTAGPAAPDAGPPRSSSGDRIDVRILDDARRFGAEAGARLAADPVGTNVIGSIVAAAATGGAASGASWILARCGADLVGVAMRTPPYPLHLPAMPDDVVAAIARALHERGDVLPAATGDVRATAVFVRHWNELTGTGAILTIAEGIHVLGEFVPPSGVPGQARPATVDDVDLVASWLADFHVEAHHGRPAPPADLGGLIRRLATGRILLWQDGGRPVSLAGWRPPAAGIGRVGPVYTPVRHRRHGYAAGVTAAATRAALAAGADGVMLFTDLANPTSNGVYARLGYRLVREASEWTFTPHADHPGS